MAYFGVPGNTGIKNTGLKYVYPPFISCLGKWKILGDKLLETNKLFFIFKWSHRFTCMNVRKSTDTHYLNSNGSSSGLV